MEKDTCFVTHIKLSGSRAEQYLRKREVLDITPVDADGNFVIGSSSTGHMHTLLGVTTVSFELVTRTNNHEVVLEGPWVKRGRAKKRKVSVNNDAGKSRQQLTKGVDIMVETTFPVAVFEKNSR